MAAAISDAATSAAARRPVRIRLALTRNALLGGGIGRLSCTVENALIAGLRVCPMRVDAYEVRLVPGWPVRVRAARVLIRATVDQAALDAWLRAGPSPLRLRLTESGLAVRAGVVGWRVAEFRAAVEIERGRLVVMPQQTQVLGLAMASPGLRVPLPLPPLPRQARLAAVSMSEGRATVTLQIPEVDEPIDPADWQRLARSIHLG